MASPRILPILSSLDDIAESIANPPPNRPFAEAVGNAGRKVCDRRSANPNAGGYGGVLGATIDTMCGPYWRDQNYSPPEPAPPPFTGGQCAVLYNVGVTVEFNGSQVQASPSPTLGPVSGFSANEVGPGPSGTREVQVVITSAGGTSSLTLNLPATNTGVSPLISRVDGLPDNCGDLPPGDEFEPGPTPAPDPGPLTPEEEPYEDPEGGPIMPIPPIPRFPGLPPIPWRNPFGTGGGSDVPGDPGSPGDSVPADGIGGASGSETAEGQAPPGSELVGLRLDLISVLPKFPDLGNGDYRGAAFIRMGTVAGLDLDSGGAIVRDGQFFYAEAPGITKWSVTANVGISWSVTPFYREVN